MNEWTKRHIKDSSSSVRFTKWINLLITIERLGIIRFEVTVERDVVAADHRIKKMMVWADDEGYMI